jgi:DNA-binding transcriptional ArsR family regulator
MTSKTQRPSSHTKSNGSARPSYGGWHGLLPAALALSRTLEREMDQALAFTRLSAAGFVVLLAIARDAPPSQEALARGLALGPASVSEQLRRLEQSGLVRRNPARRGGAHPASVAGLRAATLTDLGEAVLVEAEAIAARVERAWARRLAAAGDSPWPVARALGLRRWLTESRAAIAGQTGRFEGVSERRTGATTRNTAKPAAARD